MVGGEALSRNMENKPPDGSTPKTKWTTIIVTLSNGSRWRSNQKEIAAKGVVAAEEEQGAR